MSTNIVEFDLFILFEAEFITSEPTSLLITRPTTLPLEVPMFTLQERNSNASSIEVMHVREQNQSQVKPIINLIRNDTGPTFLDSAMLEN